MMNTLANGMLTLLMAKFFLNDVPHALDMPSKGKGLELTTVYLPLETQEAISSLLQREKGRTSMVEYGFDLTLKGKDLFPGAMKRGYKGQIGSLITGAALGFFHTHPMDTFPPHFSETDTIDIFLRRYRRLLGVGHPDYSTDKVAFTSMTKAPPPEVIFSILDNLPGILAEGVHMYELEEYYTIYEFTLGVQVLSMDVLQGWSPPKLPPRWWAPEETLEEFLKRKLG